MKKSTKRTVVVKRTAAQSRRIRRSRAANHRRAAICLALVVVLAMAWLMIIRSTGIANAAEGTDDIEYKYYTTVTVEKGETLWDFAVENYSEKYYDSIDDYIDEVKAINGLKTETIHEGAKLVIVYFSSEYK